MQSVADVDGVDGAGVDLPQLRDLLLQAAREKTGAQNARILLAENQTLYLGAGRRCGYGMIAFLGRPFPTTDAYFRML